ncbi:Nurf-38 [Bugula neritina]|uniref:Inorganic pyrophosphatase n=1 Tax=Bugula neritina TaxID=10212 RepID=A0A7J7JRM6_BUGNE|nr:Nurf-38 [Bugula neritina]
MTKQRVEGPSGACSLWHDIPLYSDKENNIFNMVVEIPRWSNAKMEMSTKGKLNYIKQDEKKGKLRFVGNVFPHHGYIWNYGAFPQTWEDPKHKDEHTGAMGDNDPLDVCEIGDTVHPIGSVIQVKVLGVMAMLDEGETDWKVLVIDVNDPLANEMNDVEDIERLKPGLLKATYEWFVLYKIPDGKPKNSFAFNGEAKNKAFALSVISQTSEQWRKLVMSETDSGGLNGASVSVEASPFLITQEEANREVESSEAHGPSSDPPSSLNKWHYIS